MSVISHVMHCASCSVADCAHLLMRSVNYEIPALKRQIAKAQQLQQVPVTCVLYSPCGGAAEWHSVRVTHSQEHSQRFMFKFSYRFSPFLAPNCTLLTAINHIIPVLERWALTCSGQAVCSQTLWRTTHFQYCNHLIGCNLYLGTRNREMSVLSALPVQVVQTCCHFSR